MPGQSRGGEQEAPETVRDDKYFSDRQHRCPWCHESDPDSRIAALEARLKEAEEKNADLQTRVGKAEEENEMLKGCILEMSETVYQ